MANHSSRKQPNEPTRIKYTQPAPRAENVYERVMFAITYFSLADKWHESFYPTAGLSETKKQGKREFFRNPVKTVLKDDFVPIWKGS